MSYTDLREFLDQLKQKGDLKTLSYSADPHLEITEIARRTLEQGGPALLFENPKNSHMPLLANLFGTQERIADAMGLKDISELRMLGSLLSELKNPTPPDSLKAAFAKLPLVKQIMHMSYKIESKGLCYSEELPLDLTQLPIQHCWPEDVAPLITWGLTVTRGPYAKRLNLGIYRQQVISENRIIMRWLPHRGGALDFQAHQKKYPGEPFPVAVVLGADPATTLAAVTPIPDTLSEYAFAGLLRGNRTLLTRTSHADLLVPSRSEIILEGFLHPGDTAPEGPYGDHTGYYNEVETFPVMTVTRITSRKDPIYLSTYTGRPPDEPAILGQALNEVFVPLLQQQFPEIIDFYLPPEGCSYRIAIVSMKKQYPGHAQRIAMGVWSYLRQFMYTKMIILVDEDINTRCWKDVMWALSTRFDAKRDSLFLENSPIDYLDFASPTSGLGSKVALDATNKWPGETSREWGRPIVPDADVVKKVDAIWDELNIFSQSQETQEP